MTVGDGFIPAALCGAGSRSVIPEWARQVSGVLRPRFQRGGAAVRDPELTLRAANYCIAKGSCAFVLAALRKLS
jgi:hypothetical protein